ncbi:MAG: hypothetical protein WB383_05225 [Acidimicrobiales bacterium]
MTSDTKVEPQGATGRWATVAALVVVAAAIVVSANPGAQLISTVGLILLPGMVLTSLIIPSGLTGLRRLLISTGVGLAAFCLLGAVAGALGPALGVGRPLSRTPLEVLWLVILALVGGVSFRCQLDPVGEVLAKLSRRAYYWGLVLVLPPCVALVGATKLNATGANAIAVIATVLGLGLILASVALSRRLGGPAQAALLGSGVVTLIWQQPTRGGWLWGWDIQHEFSVAAATITSGRFPLPHSHDPYAGMLSLTVLPAQLHFLNSMQLRTILVLIPGVMLAACAVTTLATIRRIAGPVYASFLVALLIVGTASFLTELPAIMRQSVALFFFTLVIQLVADPPAPIRRVRVLAVVMGIGLAVSHYSTAYLVAGAVVTGWLTGLALRSDRSRRVLTSGVAAGFVGAALLWGLLIAHTAPYLRQVAHAIRVSGLDFLPGSGSLLSRWVEGTASGQSVSAAKMRSLDLTARLHQFSWMSVDPRATAVRLVNAAVTPGSRGVSILGPIVNDGATAAREVILIFIVVAVIWGIWRGVKWHEHVEILGLVLFGGFISAVSRNSGTLSVQFNTERVEAQMYLVFIVMCACLVHHFRARLPQIAASILGVLATIQVALAFGIGGYAVANSSLPVALAATGSQIDLLAVTPADRDAGQWLMKNSGTRVIQADPYSALATYNFSGADRRKLILTVDPVIVDNSAWVFASSVNVAGHTARAAIGTYSGTFAFPSADFNQTRSILYVSRSDIIYGSDAS